MREDYPALCMGREILDVPRGGIAGPSTTADSWVWTISRGMPINEESLPEGFVAQVENLAAHLLPEAISIVVEVRVMTWEGVGGVVDKEA